MRETPTNFRLVPKIQIAIRSAGAQLKLLAAWELPRLIALVGNEWAPGSLGKQPAAHFPSPCSAGYPGRSREWLRPRLFGGSPRQFSGACRNHHTLFPVVGAQQPPPARRVAPESPGSGLFRLSASAALRSPLDWRRASDRSANRSSAEMTHAIIRGKNGRRYEVDLGIRRCASKFMLARRPSRFSLRQILKRMRKNGDVLP